MICLEFLFSFLLFFKWWDTKCVCTQKHRLQILIVKFMAFFFSPSMQQKKKKKWENWNVRDNNWLTHVLCFLFENIFSLSFVSVYRKIELYFDAVPENRSPPSSRLLPHTHTHIISTLNFSVCVRAFVCFKLANQQA